MLSVLYQRLPPWFELLKQSFHKIFEEFVLIFEWLSDSLSPQKVIVSFK
jgi:hypothetical protein